MNTFVKDLLHDIKNTILIIILIILRIFPIQKNKVLFISFFGKGYNDNPMLISKILENDEQVEVVWATEKGVACPSSVKQVYIRSLRYLYELATSKVWVDNARKYIWAKKRKKQFYIQTWHGPICIKAVEKDAGDVLGSLYIKGAIQDSKNANLLVSECKWRTENIRNAFWYDGDILEAEFKRVVKTKEEADRSVREFYNLKKSDKIVLYAPTFRNNRSISIYDLNYHQIINCLRKDGDDWKIVVRLHPLVSEKDNCIQYSDEILNGTQYPDINDLIMCANIIITDYSGIIFEGFRAGKIVLLYTPDLDTYINNDRKLYFDITSLPAPISRNNDELEKTINNLSLEEYERKRTAFVREIGYFEKDAAEECSKIIKNVIED